MRLPSRADRRRRWRAGVVACAIVVHSAVAMAARTDAPPPTRILTCKDAQGRPILTDPSDPRCYKAPPNEAERAAAEERRRQEVEAYNKCKADQRSNDSLLKRYPTRAKHDEARKAALQQVESGLRLSQIRLQDLQEKRKRLLEEAEFYPKGNLPTQLRRDLDANSAFIEAQLLTIANQKDEAAQKNSFYDEELAKLKKLWDPKRPEVKACVAPRD